MGCFCRGALLILGTLVTYIGVATAPAEARKSRADFAPKIVTLMMTKGDCTKLVVSGSNVTYGCQSFAVNNAFSDGRVGFLFSTKDNAIISFSGSAHQINPDPDTALQPIDRVTFTYAKKTQNIGVVGSCRYTNPYKGRATIKCEAEASDGLFEAEFLTDGKEPINALPK